MTTLSIVIPAYNEESGIADIILRVLGVEGELATAGIGLQELLVIDDASRDQTAQIAEDIAQQNPRLRVIRHAKNQGYGGASRPAFRRLRATWSVFWMLMVHIRLNISHIYAKRRLKEQTWSLGRAWPVPIARCRSPAGLETSSLPPC